MIMLPGFPTFNFKTWAIYGLGLLVLLLGLHTWSVGNRYTKLKTTHNQLLIDLQVAEASAKALQSTAALSAQAAKGVAAQKRSSASQASTKELNHAKETAPDWSATPIPDGVRSALEAARARSAQ